MITRGKKERRISFSKAYSFNDKGNPSLHQASNMPPSSWKCTSDFFPQFYVCSYVIAIQALCFSKQILIKSRLDRQFRISPVLSSFLSRKDTRYRFYFISLEPKKDK